MENFRKKSIAYFEFGFFQNAQEKDDFINGLLKIENDHISFFMNKSIGKNKVENYIAPTKFNGPKALIFRNESELTPELKTDLINLWNSIFKVDSK